MRNFILIAVTVVFLSFLLNAPGTWGGIKGVVSQTPWWAYFVLAGILYSGYRAAIHFNEDRKADLAFIEEEGNKYIERINQERDKRKANK